MIYNVIYRRGSGYEIEHNLFDELIEALAFVVNLMKLENAGRIYLEIEHGGDRGRESVIMIWHFEGEWRIS